MYVSVRRLGMHKAEWEDGKRETLVTEGTEQPVGGRFPSHKLWGGQQDPSSAALMAILLLQVLSVAPDHALATFRSEACMLIMSQSGMQAR